MSSFGNLPQVGVKIENVWNHNLEPFMTSLYCHPARKETYPPQGTLQMRDIVQIPWDQCHQEFSWKWKPLPAFSACWILLEKITILRPWVENPVCVCARAYTVGYNNWTSSSVHPRATSSFQSAAAADNDNDKHPDEKSVCSFQIISVMPGYAGTIVMPGIIMTSLHRNK